MSFYRGKKLFITGGSSGIGKATALSAVRAGASVYIAARRQSVLDEAVAELEAARTSADQKIGSISLDIADAAAVKAAVPAILEGLGGLDVLINNAGVSHVSHAHEDDDDAYEWIMRINYLGAVHVTRAFLPHFMSQRAGHVHFVSSVLGVLGCYGYGAYAASKHAMIGYAKCLHQDLLPYGVSVTVSLPPDTETPQHAAELEVMPEETKVVAGTIAPLSADFVGNAVLDGIAAQRFSTAPGFVNHVLLWAARHFPGIARWVMDRDLHGYWAKNGRPQQA